MLIEHIDAIARQKQRDVLYVEFHPPVAGSVNDEEIVDQGDFDWKTLPIRQQIIDWLDAQGIGWKPCGLFVNACVMMGYHGQIYIDLPFDEALPAFQSLQALLELPDGSMRFPDATFYCCTLELAMENAAHDEPGFWDHWAEGF